MRAVLLALGVLGLLAKPSPLTAQSRHEQPAANLPTLEAVLDSPVLADLPTTGSLAALLETTQSTLIADRFSAGGLYPTQPTRIGGFLSSWSQTTFQVGDVDVTDPSGSGTPLFTPDLALWNAIHVTTAHIPTRTNAVGLAVRLVPLEPEIQWVAKVEGVTSHGGLIAEPHSSRPPPIAHLEGWDRLAFVATGPLSMSTRASIAGSWVSGHQVESGEPAISDDSTEIVVANVVFRTGRSYTLRGLGLFQRSRQAFEFRIPFEAPGAATRRTATHVQVAWQPPNDVRLPWRAVAGYTHRRRRVEHLPSSVPVFERLRDGPVLNLTHTTPDQSETWTLGAHAGGSADSRSGISFGFEINGTRLHRSSFFAGSVGEVIDGVPARIWTFSSPGSRSRRHALRVAAYVDRSFALADRVGLDLGLGFDGVRASAQGGVARVVWPDWLPRAGLRWTLGSRQPTILFGGYSRQAHRLPLDALEFGDPAAPTADVFRWDETDAPDSTFRRGPLVARSGPGTGGDPLFTRIDDRLERPTTDEFVVGVQTWVRSPFRLQVSGVARRESNALTLVNTGVPVSSYTTISVPDANVDLARADDDQFLVIYDRLPSSFGADRYLLTNSHRDAGTLWGLEISGEWMTERVLVRGGATASVARAAAAAVGFGPLENDQSVIADIDVNPNAATYARGRVFSDRAFTVKLMAIVSLPLDTRLGMIARYQDGQPFARAVVANNLNQGAEAVRAFASGSSRFTYIGTLDMRLQRQFTLGSRGLQLFLDAYNLLNMSNEVEERIVTGPDFRSVTAVQPPRAFHIGFRVSII